MPDSQIEIFQMTVDVRFRRCGTMVAHSRAVVGRSVCAWMFWLTTSLFLATTILGPSAAAAAGHEIQGRDQDFILQVDSRWPGNAYGGYFPLRMKLSNMGAPRGLTIVYQGLDSGRGGALPKVFRTVSVEQQATINFTLSIPVVGPGVQGVVRVYAENGAELKGLMSRHELPDKGGAIPRTSLLVIATDNPDDKQLQPFEDAAVTEATEISGIRTVGSSRSSYYSPQFADRDHVVIQPGRNLPINWIDYSGVDLVAVDWQDWNSRLSSAERDALLKWTAAGGVLLVYKTGQPAAQHLELNQTLQLSREAAAGWRACTPDTFRATTITNAEAVRAGFSSVPGSTVVAPSKPSESSPWKISAETYSYRDLALGQVHVFRDNPFPGSATDWCWWLSSLPRYQSQWPAKFGMSARDENPEFLSFLIPGVGSVPIFAFLCLITVFTLVIGPLNYYWLHKRRRVALMVLTVPAIAGVTCVLLFAYSLIADGFSIRSRVHSFTWLDQQRKSAVSLSRISLYAPFAPSSGLKFSPECAVFPIWPSSGEFEGGSVDWSANDQRLSSAWFHSQTWTQFQTVENRDERGRLDFSPPKDDKAPTLSVSNGLSWDLEYLAVKVSDIQWYAGGPVPAGATAELKLIKRADAVTRFRTAAEQTTWRFPEGIFLGSRTSRPYSRRGVYYGPYQPLETNFKNGLLAKCSAAASSGEPWPQREIFDWRDGKNTTTWQPHTAGSQPSYWAICTKNPGVQTGVKSAISVNHLHLLFGTF